MAVSWLGKTSAVRQFITAVQASADAVVDSKEGSITLALAQAVTGAFLWLQAEIAKVLLLTRAKTSKGPDLDSFFADFDFFRLPAVAATTNVLFARFTATQQAVVLVGQGVTTGPGGILFLVARDTTNTAYSQALDGYVLGISVASLLLPVRCAVAGTDGNVLAGTITSFQAPIVGIDTVTNPADVIDGLDDEEDDDFRARFPLYLAGLAAADEDAIASAIVNVQRGIKYLLVENKTYPGTTDSPGNFFALIDDGSGSPPDDLISKVTAAINAIRGFTIRFTVHKPTIVTPAVALNVRVGAGYSAATVKAAVTAAVAAAVNAIPLDALTVFVSQIEAAALAVPGCVAVQPGQTTIAGVAADYAMTLVQVPRITAGNVTTGTY